VVCETGVGATGAGPAAEYLVPDWVRVRRESFGLLFYDTRSTKLTFVRCGDDMDPPPFTGARRLLRVRPSDESRAAALARLMQTLLVKGLVVAAGSDS